LLASAIAKAAPNLSTFYDAFTPVCFTLLGLWLVVVQTRHSEWRRSTVHRNRAYALSMNFALPGMMGLLSLVEPGNSSLWRVSFACVGIGGVAILGWMALGGLLGERQSPAPALATGFSVLAYAVIALVAIAPTIIKDVGIGLTALEFEAILLSVLVFLAVNVAWFLMFEDVGVGERR